MRTYIGPKNLIFNTDCIAEFNTSEITLNLHLEFIYYVYVCVKLIHIEWHCSHNEANESGF